MLELYISTVITFFVLIDPLGIAPIYGVMMDGASKAYKRRVVLKACLTGTIILLMFAFLGNQLLKSLGIGMMAFKTAGGVLLFMIALEMVFERRTERREKRSEDFAHDHDDKIKDEDIEDPSIFPLGIPFIAGPGAIASIILLMAQNSGNYEMQGIIIGALMTALVLTMIILLAAGKIIDLLGQTIATAITRILGVLLAAMATQYIFDGIKGAFLG